MPVLVSCKFDKDLIKYKGSLPILWTYFLHYKAMGKCFGAQRPSNSKENSPIWPNFERIQDVCMS